jgi:hypothetical protein
MAYGGSWKCSAVPLSGRCSWPYEGPNQEPRHNAHAQVEGHGEDGVTPGDHLIFHGGEKDDSWPRRNT